MTNSTKSSLTYRNVSSKPLLGDTEQLRAFLTGAIKEMYWGEKHLAMTLPKMYSAATTAELQDIISDHLALTQIHITRLEEILHLLETAPGGKRSEAMAGIINECEAMILETAEGTFIRDAGIILVTQKAVHYQFASYGGLAQLADALSLNSIVALLHQSLTEITATDEGLSLVAADHIHADLSTEIS